MLECCTKDTTFRDSFWIPSSCLNVVRKIRRFEIAFGFLLHAWMLYERYDVSGYLLDSFFMLECCTKDTTFRDSFLIRSSCLMKTYLAYSITPRRNPQKATTSVLSWWKPWITNFNVFSNSIHVVVYVLWMFSNSLKLIKIHRNMSELRRTACQKYYAHYAKWYTHTLMLKLL